MIQFCKGYKKIPKLNDISNEDFILTFASNVVFFPQHHAVN